MKRIETIKSKEEFNNIIRTGKYNKNQYYILYYINNNDNKFGIAISNKVGHAFIRNRLKRQTRSIIDENRNLFKKGFNYIIMIRKSCVGTNYEILNKALIELINK
jgi:ribonuclease P protein component